MNDAQWTRQPYFLLLASVLWLMFSCAAQAQVSPPDVQILGNSVQIPLGWLDERRTTPIELRGAEARHLLKLPIPARLQIESAQLELFYTNSIALDPRSQLALTLNERVMAQLPVRSRQPDHVARIQLPLSDLPPGYHDLGLRAAQHYITDDLCTDPSAPELYSQVDALQSMINLEVSRKPVRPSLGDLDSIFDERLWQDEYRLQLLLPQEQLAERPLLRQAASQMSQAVASWLDFLPVAVDVHPLATAEAPRSPRTPAPALLGGTSTPDPFTLTPRAPPAEPLFPGIRVPSAALDAVVLGTRADLEPFVSAHILQTIDEGYLGLFPADEDPTRYILIVSGSTDQQVLQMATALNIPRLALPDRQTIALSELHVDQGYRRLLPTVSTLRNTIRFSDLEYTTTSMRGMYPTPAHLEFWAFREMLNPSQNFINAYIDYVYGSGFTQSSALNVILNGQFIQAFPLQDSQGEQIFGARVRIPTVALRPGRNVLSFEPSLASLDEPGPCRVLFTDNLRVTIFESSQIELPPLSDSMLLPNLGLLTRTGLPYTRLSDAQGVGMVLGATDPETLSSALTLIGKLRQIHQAPLLALQLLTPEELRLQDWSGLIVVSSVEQLPDEIARKLTTFMPTQGWQQFALGSHTITDYAGSWQRWMSNPLAPLTAFFSTESPALAHVTLREGLGHSTALTQYVIQPEQPVTVLMAATPQDLQQGTERLIQFPIWSQIDGAAALWSPNQNSVAVVQPVDYTFIGTRPALNPLIYWMSERPWQTTLAIFSLLVLFTALGWGLLRLRAQRRLSNRPVPRK